MHRTTIIRLFVGLFASAIMWGQGFSTINGTVSDQSGAVIAGAKITATEVATSLSRTTTSGADGLYSLSALRPTSYTVTVEAPGFRNFAQTGVTLEADQTATMSVRMELGSTTDQVTVEAAAVQVDITTATMKQVITSERIEELPLNGRNAASLTTLVAGATDGPSNGVDEGATKTMPTTGVTATINGLRTNHTGYYLDGVSNTDFLSNINAPFPNPDALQEFGVQTSNYSSEYGQNAGAVVNIVTKSGTNVFHGSAFGFVRNQAFNARSFFNAQRDPLKRSQYGGALGGPIVHDKVFFFFGYQGTRLRSEATGLSGFVPTLANVGGDFSAALSATNPNNPQNTAILVKDPLSGQPFPGNIIPPTRLDSTSLNLVKGWLPKVGGNGLSFYSRPSLQDLREYIIKLDYNIRANDRMAVRYFRNPYDGPGTLVNNDLRTYTDYANFVFNSLAVTESHVFTPTLLNDLRIGFTYEADFRGPPPNAPSVKGFGSQITQGSANAIEGVNVNGFFNFGSFPVGKFPRAGISFADTLGWVHGRHTMSFSGSFERDRLNEVTETNMNGVFAFTNQSTGSALADFMLGRFRTFTQGNGYVQYDRYKIFSLAFQDTFKASNRLSLSMGLRWEPSLPWEDRYHESTVFFPAMYEKGIRSSVYTKAPVGEFFPGDPGVPASGRGSDWMNFAPRVGFAYDVFGNGKTSIRGGLGMTYDSRVPGFSNNRQAQATPFSLAVTLTGPTTGVAPTFTNPYLGSVNPFPAALPPPKDTPFPTPVLVYTWSPEDRLSPVVYSANLAIEHQLSSSWLVRTAYIGTHSSHLNVNLQENPGIYIPGSTAAIDTRRYYKGFAGIIRASSGGNSLYNSSQTTIQKRLSHGLSILANYTFSKALDNVPVGTEYVTPTVGATYAIPSSFNNFQNLDRGPSDFDRRHVVSISYVWQIPGLGHSNPLVRGVLGGWQISGITSGRSGTQLTVASGTDRSMTGINRDRADLVPGKDLYTSGACANIATPCFNYFNTAAYVDPTLGQFGNVGKGVLRGPGSYNLDLSLSKIFKIRENLTIRPRAEAFNALNHMNLGDPTASRAGTGFGQIRSGSNPRIIQLALKIVF